MFQFDLSKEPLTNQELKTELQILKKLRKVQIKYSCIADVFHATVFIGLYFSHLLSGYAALFTIAVSTIFAAILAIVTSQTLKFSDRLALGIIASGTTIATIIILITTMKEPVSGSSIAGLAAGSIVIVGVTLGRKIKQVMVAIEDMKPTSEDETAQHQLMILCRKFPDLNEYRELAVRNLRPNLTYGELAAMENWAKKQD